MIITQIRNATVKITYAGVNREERIAAPSGAVILF